MWQEFVANAVLYVLVYAKCNYYALLFAPHIGIVTCTVDCMLISIACCYPHLAGVLYIPSMKQSTSMHEMSLNIEVIKTYV